MNDKKFSVIIPLYNKKNDIGATISSVLAQTLQPYEIVVVDDGSTDASAEVVESFASPLIRLIRQPNAGECAARNRAIAEAEGDYMSLLDADDCWRPDYLKTIDALIDRFPSCGIYCTGVNIITNMGEHTWPTSLREVGPVSDYFRTAMRGHICLPSCATIPKEVFDTVGGFPEGMKLGGDQYMWIKIASRYDVCFTPEVMLDYSTVAVNRSSSIYTPEKTKYAFRDFYDPAQHDRNEFIARCAIGKAISISVKGGTHYAKDVARFYAYTRSCRKELMKLRILNNLPLPLRAPLLNSYNKLAWLLAHKI